MMKRLDELVAYYVSSVATRQDEIELNNLLQPFYSSLGLEDSLW